MTDRPAADNTYKPYPRKDDGFLTRITIEVDGRQVTQTYVGYLAESELDEYLKMWTLEVKSLIVIKMQHFQFKSQVVLNKQMR